MAQIPTPASSSPASSRPRTPRTPLSLDLSSLPPLSMPTPATNTLIITALTDTDIFRPENLQILRDSINAKAFVHSFAPLRSFARIIISFFSTESATAVRQILDGTPILGCVCRVFYGQQTSITARDEHLPLPDAGKLFFISPPPSPPHGWQMKLEDAPNKMVHADDLAEALAKLHHRPRTDLPASPLSATGDKDARGESRDSGLGGAGRWRSGSVTIYRPGDHGDSPCLPCIEVEDFTNSPGELEPSLQERPIMAHTARPPMDEMDLTA